MEPSTTEPTSPQPSAPAGPRPEALCETCGAVLVYGRCFRGHGTPVKTGLPSPTAARPTEPATLGATGVSGATAFELAPGRRRGSGVLFAVLAGALVTSLAVGGITFARVHERVDVLSAQVDDLTQEQVDLRGQAEADQRENEQLRTDLSNLEASLDAPELAEVAAKVGASVLTIESPGSLGSGFVIGSQGGRSQVVTNLHVVADAWFEGDKTVDAWKNDTRYPARIERVSETQDLALLTIDGAFEPLEVAASRVAPGVAVAAIGSPLGLETSISTGIASGYRPEVGIEVLQFSAAISPGNSGGAVINDAGEVVGIAVAKLTGEGVEGLAFAIPADRICTDLGVC
jgi:S1-C subfamily serine protease